ncbi:TetR/AcrR family transcriptional regulator [Amycolatopsis sp. cmx-11-51]|uniref:TetR/AcrR family transcriptional regulator n=1 Tax=Amycolatopsis sp. cmx-11-51 TaxID=2785797 RepID=UPI0039E23A02
MQSENQPAGQRTFVDQARRNQLVDCAIEAIAQVGLARASLTEIGKRAGLSKAAVFYHFSGRDELVGEVVVTVLRRGAEYMAARMPERPTPPEELRAYIEANVGYVAEHRDDVKVLVAIAVGFTDENGESKLRSDASVYEASLAPLRDILSRGQADGYFGEFDTRTTAMTIRAAIDAIGPQLTAVPGLDLAAYARDLVALFERATAR